MEKWFLVFLSLLSAVLEGKGQAPENNEFLYQLMMSEPETFSYFLDRQDSLELQIIYTRIDRDANNRPSFTTYFYHVDPTRYFYPASTVKLPVVLLSLEKLHRLNIRGIDKFTPMFTDSVYSGQESQRTDSTAENNLPSIAQYTKKILVVSENSAYNRLYEFLGQHDANDEMHQKGYSIRLLHRLDRSLSPDQNRHTEAVRFVRGDSILYSQPMLVNDSIPVERSVFKGVAYLKNDSLIHEPFDFTYKNFFPLTDQQEVLKALVFPGSIHPKKRFDITEDDRRFVLKYMSQLPIETSFPAYCADTTYRPACMKYLLYAGVKDTIPNNLRIFNKAGDAYGYLIDNAYVVDFRSGVEFFLSAVIHANQDGIYNDGDYDYEKIGYPFMREIGQLIYRYELRRFRICKPDLREFRFHYDCMAEGPSTRLSLK
jgi:Beta-lactamase enzyme family